MSGAFLLPSKAGNSDGIVDGTRLALRAIRRFVGGLDIGHDRNPGNWVLKGFGKIRQKIMGDSVACVNNPRIPARLFLQAARGGA